MTDIKNGDKVMCLYRDPKPNGQIRLGKGIVTSINKIDELTLFSVRLDILNIPIIVNNMFPYGAITHYNEELYNEVWEIYYKVFELIHNSEKKYFEMFGAEIPDNTILEPRGDMFD